MSCLWIIMTYIIEYKNTSNFIYEQGSTNIKKPDKKILQTQLFSNTSINNFIIPNNQEKNFSAINTVQKHLETEYNSYMHNPHLYTFANSVVPNEKQILNETLVEINIFENVLKNYKENEVTNHQDLELDAILEEFCLIEDQLKPVNNKKKHDSNKNVEDNNYKIVQKNNLNENIKLCMKQCIDLSENLIFIMSQPIIININLVKKILSQINILLYSEYDMLQNLLDYNTKTKKIIKTPEFLTIPKTFSFAQEKPIKTSDPVYQPKRFIENSYQKHHNTFFKLQNESQKIAQEISVPNNNDNSTCIQQLNITDILQTYKTDKSDLQKLNDLNEDQLLNIPLNLYDTSDSDTKDSVEPINEKINYGDLSSGENEDIVIFEEAKYDGIYKVKNYEDPDEVSLYNQKKLIHKHRDAQNTSILTTEIDFITQRWILLENSQHDITKLPVGMSFSPGWHRHNSIYRKLLNSKVKNSYYERICKNYELKNYYSLILTMMKVNTCTKKNKFISMKICFHLICFHLCTAFNLGCGKNIKIDKSNSFWNYINTKNYQILFKTKQYWMFQAEILHNYARDKAKKELDITESSFTPSHLFNILHLISKNDPYRVSFVCFVYHASIESELDKNLSEVSQRVKDEVIIKRKKLFKIKREYSKYVKIAHDSFKR
ncbi:hypothetical protein NUSPORA_01157 [Nucleospora cyclopteri]